MHSPRYCWNYLTKKIESLTVLLYTHIYSEDFKSERTIVKVKTNTN